MEGVSKKMKNLCIVGLYILLLSWFKNAESQICDSITPVFYADLSGQPNGTWTSPLSVRDGHCCGVTNPEVCIEFIVTLDSSTNGIRFDIASGAVPSGALFYQVNCGPAVQVGQPICLNGPGPHLLTFCKPGNNSNNYRITSIPKPSVDGTRWVSQACSGKLVAQGLIDTSIHWSSMPYNAAYNSFLSCTSGCDTVYVTPNGGLLPAYVDYQVCGYVIGGCIPFIFCDTIRVNFVNDLAVSITPQNPTICYGGTNVTVTAVPGGGRAPYHYLWSNGATTQSVLLGQGTFSVQITDSMNCSTAFDTVTVNALPSPIAANAGSDVLLCSQQGAQLNGSVIAATGGQWFGGTGIFSPNDTMLNAVYSPSASEISSGVANLFLVTTGNSSCPADTDQMNILIFTDPQPSVSGNLNVCEFAMESYTALYVSGIIYAWSVSGGTILSMSSNLISVQWDTAGSGIITLTETNASTCDSTISISVNINPQPVPVIWGPNESCVTTVSQYDISTPDTTNSYTWNVSGGTITGTQNTYGINVRWFNAGNGSVSLTATNNSGCDSTVIMPVLLYANPTPSLNGPRTSCEQAITTYTVPYVQGNSYSWTVTNGNIVGFSVSNTIDVYWNIPGTGNVTVTESTPHGCDSTMSMSVRINPKPNPVISGVSAICENEFAFYTSNADSGSIYDWYVSGGIFNSNAMGNSINVFWTTTGYGFIDLIETSINGCSNETYIQVMVDQKPAPSVFGNHLGCISSSQNNYSTVIEQSVNYYWSVTGGIITAGNGTNSIAVQWTTPGSNQILLFATNTQTGCDSMVSLAVMVDSLARPAIRASGLNGCAPLNLSLMSNVLDSTYHYAWNFGDGFSSSVYNTSHSYTHPGTYPLVLIVTNNTGCADTVHTQVTVYNSPSANFFVSFDSDIYYAGVSELGFTNQSSGAIHYLWQFGNGDTSSMFEPPYQYSQPGIYQVLLTATNQYGCRANALVPLEVKVPEEIFIPNAFTPDGDNNNDFFNVKSQNITGLNVSIFDRWGQEIYTSNDPSFKWDGTFKGRPVQQDVYVYMIKAQGYHGKQFDLSGSVTVLR